LSEVRFHHVARRGRFRLLLGDRFLLCRYDLFKALPERELPVLLGLRGGEAAQRLNGAAVEERADDNVTVVTIEALATVPRRVAANSG
jgi:hypothetical protein